jgi:hypothetical protein
MNLKLFLLLLPALLAAGCSNSASHRGGYLLSRGFAPYDKENPLARATALAVSADAVAGVAPNKAGEFHFFQGDLESRRLDVEPVASREAGEARLAQLKGLEPAAWRSVRPGSPEARAAMRVLNVDDPRRPYAAGTTSRLGDDRPPEAISDIKAHTLPDGGGNFPGGGN